MRFLYGFVYSLGRSGMVGGDTVPSTVPFMSVYIISSKRPGDGQAPAHSRRSVGREEGHEGQVGMGRLYFVTLSGV